MSKKIIIPMTLVSLLLLAGGVFWWWGGLVPSNPFQTVFASSEGRVMELPQRDVKAVLKEIQKQLQEEAVASEDCSDRQAALLVTRNTIVRDQIPYWFSDLSKDLFKTVLKVIKFSMPDSLFAQIWRIVEAGDNLNEATHLLESWLTGEDIKLAVASVSSDKTQSIWYIMISSPLDDNHREIIAEFFSPKIGKVELPSTRRGSYGGAVLNPCTENGELESFKLSIKGRVRTIGLLPFRYKGGYVWEETTEAVTVNFPGDVPELTKKPLSWWQKIENTIASVFSKIKDALSRLYPPKSGEPAKEEGLVEERPRPVLTSPLEIIPRQDEYQVGETLTAKFTLTNKGGAPVTFDKLTVGGRFNEICPDDKCPDFSFKKSTLEPGQSYQYMGTLRPNQAGNYHFFIAYYIRDPNPEEKTLLDPNNWNTSVDLGEGLADKDRIEDIVVTGGPPSSSTEGPLEEATEDGEPARLPSKVTAYVFNQHGDPVVEAKYWLMDSKGKTYPYYRDRTSETGYLESRAVSDKEYTLQIKKEDYDLFEKKIQITASGISLGTIVMHKWSKVTAYVIDQHGDPVVEAKYWLMDSKGKTYPYYWNRTSETGYLESRAVPDGNYTLHVEKRGYNPLKTGAIVISGSDISLGRITINKE